MTRIHIPFRTGEAAGLTATEVRTRAAEFRKDILEEGLRAFPDSHEASLSVHAALRLLGGRLYQGSWDQKIPLDQTLSLEVWAPQDFVLYECPTANHGSALRSFAYIGSYLMHFLDCPEKWIAEDGSPIGMQWAWGRDGASSMKGAPRQEAFTFAWEVIAPYDVVKSAVELMGEKDYYMPFAGQLRRKEVEHRAKALGLIVSEDATA